MKDFLVGSLEKINYCDVYDVEWMFLFSRTQALNTYN